MIALIDEGDERSIIHFEIFDRTKAWENETFYINRFFPDDSEEFDIVESDDIFKLEAWLS